MKRTLLISLLSPAIIFTFVSACGPFGPFDHDPQVNPPPDYELEDPWPNWLCHPDKEDPCDWRPPGSDLSDNQATAEADCFAISGVGYILGNTYNANPQLGEDVTDVCAHGPFADD